MEIINDIMNKAKGDVKKLIEKIQVGGRQGLGGRKLSVPVQRLG